jgi:predicted Zn-dependent protease
VPDSLEFQLVRARLQGLAFSPRDAVDHFQAILSEKRTVNEAAARYGLVQSLLRAKEYARADREMTLLRRQAPADAMIDALAAQVKVAAGDLKGAAAEYEQATKRFPKRRALVYGYARLLLDAKRPAEALSLISEALQSSRSDVRLYRLQAEAFAALGQRLQQHRAQAEAYLLMGSLPGAIEQLQLGLRSGDGDFYQLSSAEARLKELRELDAVARKRSQP